MSSSRLLLINLVRTKVAIYIVSLNLVDPGLSLEVTQLRRNRTSRRAIPWPGFSAWSHCWHKRRPRGTTLSVSSAFLEKTIRLPHVETKLAHSLSSVSNDEQKNTGHNPSEPNCNPCFDNLTNSVKQWSGGTDFPAVKPWYNSMGSGTLTHTFLRVVRFWKTDVAAFVLIMVRTFRSPRTRPSWYRNLLAMHGPRYGEAHHLSIVYVCVYVCVPACLPV
eukprot:SAG11_NODE_495_length_8943_cov_274.008028_4_plen_219_part_00